jgi:hypothetical protein
MDLLVCPSASPSLLLSLISLSHYVSELLHTVHRLSTKTKGSKYVCFTISRGDGLPDEKWLEIVDTASTLKYYFNPQTWVTAASPSVSSSLSRQSHPMGYSNSHQEAVTNPSAGVPSGRPLIRE